MFIVGIDPGGTTGFCVVDTEARTVVAKQLSSHDDVVNELEIVFGVTFFDVVVVIEDFVGAGRRDTNIIETLKLLGYVQLTCRRRGIMLATQVPQYRKPFVDIAELKFPKHSERHCKDAYAHVLAYVQTHAIRGGDLEQYTDARTFNDQLSVGPRGRHTNGCPV